MAFLEFVGFLFTTSTKNQEGFASLKSLCQLYFLDLCSVPGVPAFLPILKLDKVDKVAASDGKFSRAFEHRFQKSFPVCRSIDEQQPAAEESEPAAQPSEALEEVASPRDDLRVRILFERCLIACALYEEFWTRVKSLKLMPTIQWSHPNSVFMCICASCVFCVCSVHSVPGITKCRGGASGF